MRRKVTVVGAGNVGATCAQVLAAHDYADVVLVDIKEGLPQGKALDINQMGAVLG
jgi:malate dehydrogenase